MKPILFTTALFAIGIFLFKADAHNQTPLQFPSFDAERTPISTGPSYIQYPNGYIRPLKHNEIVSILGPREVP
jgi:hypothetical protein